MSMVTRLDHLQKTYERPQALKIHDLTLVMYQIDEFIFPL